MKTILIQTTILGISYFLYVSFLYFFHIPCLFDLDFLQSSSSDLLSSTWFIQHLRISFKFLGKLFRFIFILPWVFFNVPISLLNLFTVLDCLHHFLKLYVCFLGLPQHFFFSLSFFSLISLRCSLMSVKLLEIKHLCDCSFKFCVLGFI